MKKIKTILQNLRKDDDGVVYVMSSLLLVPFIIVVAIAVEVSRASYIDTRLAYAADAAALAGARYNIDEVQDNAKKVFYANFQNGTQDVYVTPQVTVSSDQNFVSVSVSGQMPTILGKFADIFSLRVKAYSQVQRSYQGLELALVLDTTGSMASNNKMTGLIKAGQNLIDIIYGSNKTRENVAISIVPYVATVNIGTSKLSQSWLKDPDTLKTFPTNAPWGGCVNAIDIGSTYDTDAPPSDSRKWSVYYTASTYGKVSGKGDNDWIEKPAGTVYVVNKISSVPTIGPNRSCGAPLLPLTNDRDILKSKIASLAPVGGGGTFGNLGLVWGWNTISPRWNGVWDKIAPQDYDKVNKYILIITDGENLWNYISGYTPTEDPTAYGSKISEGRLGATTLGQAATKKINDRLIKLCDSIKATGTKIFTVTFQVSNSTAKDIYKQCASKSEWAFQAEDSQQLYTFFSQIGETVKKVIIVK